MPPSTRGSVAFSARIAWAARVTISEKRTQPGSTTGSQWDLLLGSFQIIAASIIGRVLQADREEVRSPDRVRRLVERDN